LFGGTIVGSLEAVSSNLSFSFSIQEIAITLITVDVNLGEVHTTETVYTPAILVKAVADAPGIEVTQTTTTLLEDDGEVIPLHFQAIPSADTDGSETLSVRLTVPNDNYATIGNITRLSKDDSFADIVLSEYGEGVYMVTSESGDAVHLNNFLDGGLAFKPRENFAGTFQGLNGIKVDVISTEAAQGIQVEVDSATVTDYIDIKVLPVLDLTIVSVKGNAVGDEDTKIPIPIDITLGDPDGSESFKLLIESSNLPEGTTIYGDNGALMRPSGENGQYVLSPADSAELKLQPPENYSSPQQGDITLLTTTVTQETGVEEVSSVALAIPVAIRGVADPPSVREISVIGNEDEPYDLGAAVEASGPLEEILVDTDGSETLFLYMDGLPQGVVPTVSAGEINYLGNQRFQVDGDSIRTLKLPPVKHYSGDNPYSSLRIRATSQEVDGSQSNSGWWKISYAISPIIDGFGGSWRVTQHRTESNLEAGSEQITFSHLNNLRLVDLDGSEKVLEYRLNLTNLITDAGIGVYLQEYKSISTLSEFVSSFVTGTFSFNESSSILTVLKDHVSSLKFLPEPFKDSNQDFSFPAEVLVRDRATINGDFIDSIGYVSVAKVLLSRWQLQQLTP